MREITQTELGVLASIACNELHTLLESRFDMTTDLFDSIIRKAVIIENLRRDIQTSAEATTAVKKILVFEDRPIEAADEVKVVFKTEGNVNSDLYSIGQEGYVNSIDLKDDTAFVSIKGRYRPLWIKLNDLKRIG